jgi:hypothetical protein
MRGDNARDRVVDASCFGTHMIRVGIRDDPTHSRIAGRRCCLEHMPAP